MNGLIFEALKRTLKARGVTYRELAERMGVSEPTVKRIFHERNCKLDRLVEICAAAGVELENVLGSMSRGPGPVNRIAPEIERKLAGRPALLFIFVMLSEKFTPEGIMRSQGLSEASMFLYLRDLEALGLIALGSGLSARLLVDTPIQWNFEGPLRPLFEMTNKNFIGWAISHLEREATFVSLLQADAAGDGGDGQARGRGAGRARQAARPSRPAHDAGRRVDRLQMDLCLWRDAVSGDHADRPAPRDAGASDRAAAPAKGRRPLPA